MQIWQTWAFWSFWLTFLLGFACVIPLMVLDARKEKAPHERGA